MRVSACEIAEERIVVCHAIANASEVDDISPHFCTGSCPVLDSHANAIGEQQLKQAKLLVLYACIVQVSLLPKGTGPLY